MGHENGGWMNSDQRDAVADDPRRQIAKDLQRKLRERYGDAYVDELIAEARAVQELGREAGK